MIYVVKPTPARLLRSGDVFRDGGHTIRVLRVEDNEISYSIEPSKLVNHFFAHPDDVVDRIIDFGEN